MQDGNGGSSVRTFLACRDFIELKCVDTFVLENVDSIGDEHEETSNLARCLTALREMNNNMYKVVSALIRSSDYALPQSRHPFLKWVGICGVLGCLYCFIYIIYIS